MAILRTGSSANTETSVTWDLTDRIIATLGDNDPRVITTSPCVTLPPRHCRRSSKRGPLPPRVSEDDRTEEQKEALKQSDTLIAEIMAADTLIIGTPVYTFSEPASLTAWL